MKLNHLNLTVTDVCAAAAFLERYFGLQRIGGNASLAVLSDGGGFMLTLMKAKRDELEFVASSRLAGHHTPLLT